MPFRIHFFKLLSWGVLIAAPAGLHPPLFAQAIPLSTADLRLPSDSAGDGGTLAVRLTYPADPADYRYPDGAPVAVYLPGGMRPGGLGGGSSIAQAGFVLINFLFPGGREGAFSSDGVYDDRGDACQRAVRDVVLFAMGGLRDSAGRTLDEVVPGPVRYGIVGLAPFSNGLIGLITLSRYGDVLPFTPYHAGWENPTGAQAITVDLGGIRDDCDATLDSDGNGEPGDDGRNPWYDPLTGYSPTSCTVDFTKLEFDPVPSLRYEDNAGICAAVNQAGEVFLDGRTNGRVDFRPGKPGCQDFDGDGRIETTEDFILGKWHTFDTACRVRFHYTVETTRALRDRGVFAGPWPAWIDMVEESQAFWELRDATGHFGAIAARFPGFKGITVFTRQDHVQSQPDHPHVRQTMDGFQGQGLWFRLNPDAVYFQAISGSLPAGYAETPAGAAIPLGEMKNHAEPRGTAADLMGAAANAELADRIYSGCWWPDLGALLRPGVVPDAVVGDLVLEADRTTLHWTPAAGAFCYDLLRGDVGGLSIQAGKVFLSGAVCLEEDSPDTGGADPDAPPAGHAWYYLVKPNGLDGHFGTARDGAPRVAGEGACGG